ncbi:MAG: hypothetical protein KBD64_05410 [Gammaproteobacteria bacterium]|nr:hypothetical protein [Gammaproteobacteria bacterium]
MLWQQKKIANIEVIQLSNNKLKQIIIEKIFKIITSYKELDSIPRSFVIDNISTSWQAKITQISQDNLNTELLDQKCGLYRIYKIALDTNEKYPSKLHIFVAVCEDINQYINNGKNINPLEFNAVGLLKILPISSIIRENYETSRLLP